MSSKVLFQRITLSIIFVILAVSLAGFIRLFGEYSLQMDFSAYYTAGESLNHKLNPYTNHVLQTPPIWDGVCNYTHSRFLYPPLVAKFFQPIALIDYLTAKHLWMVLNLFLILISLLICAKIAEVPWTWDFLLISGIVSFSFYPILLELERGQIDGLTLFLMISGIFLITLKDSWKLQGFGGLLFAFATLIKLYCGFVLPFLIFRKKWKAVFGFIIGSGLIIILSYLFIGPKLLHDYIVTKMPRISEHGESGNEQMKINSFLAKHKPGLKDGIQYHLSSFRNHFSFNASLVKVVEDIMKPFGRNLSRAHLSMILLMFFSLSILLWQILLRFKPENRLNDLMYWLMVMIVILFCGPFTWAMNTTWLLTLLAVIWGYYPRLRKPSDSCSLGLMVIGLFLCGIRDNKTIFSAAPALNFLMDYKYIAGESCIFLGLLWALSRRRENSPSRNHIPS